MIGLAIDCETSGLPARGMTTDDPQFPWAVQIGAVLFDETGREHGMLKTVVRPDDGRTIHPEAEKVHGLSVRDCAKLGISEKSVLAVICNLAWNADYLVGYNLRFDREIIEALLIRHGQKIDKFIRPRLQAVDLIQPCAAICKIPSDHESGSYRWPKLDRACKDILGEEAREGAHDALEDARKAKRLFLELTKRGVLEVA